MIQVGIDALLDELEVKGGEDALNAGAGNDALLGDNAVVVSATLTDPQAFALQVTINTLVEE